MKDYYKVLGVPEQATGDEIKTAYRKLAKKYHPDVVKGDKEKETQMYEIQEAYQCLGDKEKRKNYDLSRRKKHTNFKPGFKPQTGKETKNVHGHPDSGRTQFEQFFGFQPGKGVDSYRGENHTAAKPEGPIKPEEMFASFFGKQEEKGGRQ